MLKKRRRKPLKGVLGYRLLTKKLISLRTEPAVLTNKPRELTVSANLAK
jgi:hypothetical protein